VRDGATFPLGLELELPSPPLYGRAAFRHDVTWLGGERKVGHDEELHGWNTQSSSHWDGFRHIRHPDHGFYGGVADDDHGVDHWAERGIVGRAVLCDVAGFRAIDHANADAISADDVRGALAAQGVEIETGDILLLHTGWVTWYRTHGRHADRSGASGLVGSDDTVRFLWDLHIAALAADNPAVEVWPPARGAFIHQQLLPLLGLPLGELWDLGPLAAACREDGRWTCLLVSAPLRLAHGVATPANAVAIR
jgi:kynurenine formamidase